MKRSRFAAVLVGLAGCVASAAACAQDTWTYEASPFLWAAGLDGRAGIGGAIADVDAGFKDLIEFVDIGLALRCPGRSPCGQQADVCRRWPHV